MNHTTDIYDYDDDYVTNTTSMMVDNVTNTSSMMVDAITNVKYI